MLAAEEVGAHRAAKLLAREVILHVGEAELRGDRERPERRREEAYQRATAAEFFRWLVAVFLLIAIGYYVFSDKFVGTHKDLLMIFLWGFGTDVGIAGAVQAGGKLKN